MDGNWAFPVPAIIADAGEKASENFLEFFPQL
jgi:hypothetical protein